MSSVDIRVFGRAFQGSRTVGSRSMAHDSWRGERRNPSCGGNCIRSIVGHSSVRTTRLSTADPGRELLGWLSRALPLVAIAATVAIFTPFARLNINAYHDGAVLKPTLDVLAGKTLFRDTLGLYAIGITHLQA